MYLYMNGTRAHLLKKNDFSISYITVPEHVL